MNYTRSVLKLAIIQADRLKNANTVTLAKALLEFEHGDKVAAILINKIDEMEESEKLINELNSIITGDSK